MQRKVPSAITNITLNRATFTDVSIDTAGAIIGCVFYIIILKIILNLKESIYEK